jgi:ubiquinone/menaquinone biosynthesis C-methylase UbiE
MGDEDKKNQDFQKKSDGLFCFAKRLANQKGLKMDKDNIMSTAAAYDVIAKEFYEWRKSHVISPSFFKLLGNVAGKKILDVGCGPGLYDSLLIKRGAIVKGIDISSELIGIAKKEAPTAELIIGDVTRLPYKNLEFDIVISIHVLYYLNSWDQVLKEIHAVLKKGGIFIFFISNPFAHRVKRQKWFFKRFRVIKGYFDEGEKYTRMGLKNKKVKMVQYHKTFATIIKLLIKYGFEIIDYEDCKPAEEAKELFPTEYETCLNFPFHCGWKLRKP